MKKLSIFTLFVLFSVQSFAQGFNGRQHPSTISSAEILLSPDSLINRVMTSAAVRQILQQKIDAAVAKSLADAKKVAADSAAKAISRAGINPNDLITNPVMNQWVDSKISGSYFAPTAISFGTITANSIQPVLATVTGATSYTLQRNGTNIATLLPGNLTYTDANLTAGTAYSYSATATDGSKVSMPVTASATTLAPTVDNSIASTGYSVVGFLDFGNLGTTRGPNQYNGYYDRGVYFETSNNGSLSVLNGIATANASGSSIKITASFITAKTYRFVLYNTHVDPSQYMSVSPAANITYEGNNSVYTWSPTVNSSAVFIQLNGINLSMSAFKLEVSN